MALAHVHSNGKIIIQKLYLVCLSASIIIII